MCNTVRFCILSLILANPVYSILPSITPLSLFKILPGTSSKLTTLTKALVCGETSPSVQDCAIECFQRDQSGIGCPGFYHNPTQGTECHLCRMSKIQDIQGSLYTTFTVDHMVYLLASDSTVPEVAMTFDNHSGRTIPGKGTTGTTFSVSESDYVAGKKGTALRLQGGSKVQLSGSETECWTNIEHCTAGVTMSIWVKPMHITTHNYIVGTGIIFQRGFGFRIKPDGGLMALVTLDNGRKTALSKSTLVVGNWYQVTCMYKAGDGISIYMNGILEEGTDEADVSIDHGVMQVDWNAHIGVRDSKPYNSFPLNGYVDEFKYHYRIMNHAGQ